MQYYDDKIRGEDWYGMEEIRINKTIVNKSLYTFLINYQFK